MKSKIHGFQKIWRIDCFFEISVKNWRQVKIPHFVLIKIISETSRFIIFPLYGIPATWKSRCIAFPVYWQISPLVGGACNTPNYRLCNIAFQCDVAKRLSTTYLPMTIYWKLIILVIKKKLIYFLKTLCRKKNI